MVNISIVSVHCVKNDAISNIMKTYSDWIRDEDGYSVKCYGFKSEYTQEELSFQVLEFAGHLLLDAHFQSSQIVIFQYGIYYPWMDLVSLAPVNAKVLAIFHNVTPKEFVAVQHHGLLDKSVEQIQNLQLVDYVVCDSLTNLKELRAHGVSTPATILPLWYKRIYGTPSCKPSFYDHVTRIAFLGRFVKSKGGMDLLSAIELYLDKVALSIEKQAVLELTIMCNRDHSDRALLDEAQRHALKLKRNFQGRVKIKFLFNASDDQKFQILQDADIFALPTYHEGFCVPIVEALSNGCRIVSYNNSNVPFVAGHDAHLAQTGDIASLTEQLSNAICVVNGLDWWSDREQNNYTAFIRAQSEHLVQFSSATARRRLFKLFNELLKHSQSVMRNEFIKLAHGFGDLTSDALVMPERSQVRRPLGINALGFFSGVLGLGEAARAMALGLGSTFPLELIDLRVTALAKVHDQTFTNFEMDFKFAINLTMLNPSEHEYAVQKYGISKFQGRYNIGLWYWELVDVIPEWRAGSKLIDELWVTTSYIRDNMVQFAPVPVHKVTIPIVIDETKVSYSRKPFALPESTFLFVFAFDHNSIMSRKNPMSVIEAYRLAFGNRKDVGLVVKTINSDKQPERQKELNEAIKNLNAFIVDGELDRYQSFSLYAACNCYVSLHRAEGLGLAMAESMLLGKPVIATGYSGNMEFMNHHNSMPVRYKMVEILEDQNLYRKGQWWAEPDVEHAAECMQTLVDDAELCKALGERAKNHIQTHFSLEKAHQSMYARLNQIADVQGKNWGFCA